MRSISRRPSPAMIVAVIALVAGLSGSAIAAQPLTKKDVKKIADKRIAKKAPGLSVANAATADNASAVGGKSLAQVQPLSAFNQNAAVVSSLGTSFVTMATTNITTTSETQLVSTGSAELFGNGGDGDRGQCQIAIDGATSLAYEGDADDVGTSNAFTIAPNFATTLAAGTHSVTLQCRALTGTVGKDDAAVSVIAIPTGA